MRTFAILVLLALMPVRLWASDAMGIRMAIGGNAEASQAAASAAAHAGAMAAMPEDCPMKRLAAEAHGQGDETKAACENCHLCTVSVVHQSPPLFAPHRATALVALPCTSYASACRAPDLRPPIS